MRIDTDLYYPYISMFPCNMHYFSGDVIDDPLKVLIGSPVVNFSKFIDFLIKNAL